MKSLFFILLSLLNLRVALAQNRYADSVRLKMQNAPDTILKWNERGAKYASRRQDSAMYHALKLIELSEKINFPFGALMGYNRLGFLMLTASNYPKAMELDMKALKIAEQLKVGRALNMAASYGAMATINRVMGHDTLSYIQSLMTFKLYKDAKVDTVMMNFGSFMNISLIFLGWKKPDSALYYAQRSLDVALHYPEQNLDNLSVAASHLAHVYEVIGNYSLARKYYALGLQSVEKYPPSFLTARFLNNYAGFFKIIGKPDSCIYYARIALQLSQSNKFGEHEHASRSAELLEQMFELQHRPDSALKYMKYMMTIRDTIYSQSKARQVLLLNFDEDQRQKDIQREVSAARERYSNQVRFYASIATAGIFILLSLILYRNNRNKQIANKALELQKTEIDLQRNKAEKTLHELRTTQTQLIQSEKMASLGELTAGIAHEIQNPLNFVNNFSEVNAELIDEMKAELSAGKIREGIALADSIRQNEQKIIDHGKRADSIVKGMLQHSREATGQKEPVNMNALADEYLRLSYQGLRAKDKSFNATLQTQLDPGMGKINIIPQDIGRVLLNLYNNAFYAVSEKQKKQPDHYEPTVSVSTRKTDGKFEIRVKDNGNGIPQKVVDKIFQPFFTTKPTGQGTGLGLSLSYDIIKAHSGEIKVETKEGEGAEFIIQLPV